MNIYDFFNSPDVAEHCQNIGHSFNALESAVMISQSNKRTLTEKHAAYRTIIAEYPDLGLIKALNHGHIKSFHQALRDVIADEEQILEKLLLPEPGAVYQASFRNQNDYGSYNADSTLYSTYEKALSDALDNYDDNVLRANICKKILDRETWVYLGAEVSRSGEIISVDNTGLIPMSKDDHLLEACCIDVPVPFKRGDLVECDHDGGYMGNVYVVQNICRDNPKRQNPLFAWGDLSDMTAYVHYYHHERNSIECECMHFYPDLRYCRRELQGGQRILKYVSLYMQDALCLCNLLKLQKYFLQDKNMREDFLAEIIAKEDMLTWKT